MTDNPSNQESEQTIMKRTDLAKPEHIEAAVKRAEEVLARSRTVNAAQYAHGINSTRNWIECYLAKVKAGTHGDYGGLNMLHEKVMQLGGYLFALKEGI